MQTEKNIRINRKRLSNFKLSKHDIVSWLIMLPALFLFFVLVWKPIFTGFRLSFYQLKGYDPVEFVGIKNYIEVISNSTFLKTLKNTVSYVVWSLIIGYPMPIILAIMINEMVHIKSFFKFTVYFPAMVPSVAASLLWYFLYLPGDGGVFNMLLAKIGVEGSQWLQNASLTIPLIVISMTWRGMGGTSIFYLASLQSVNNELYEAATIDGANLWQKTKNITLPHISGFALLQFVNQIVGIFQIMNEPMAMTDGGPNDASVSLNLLGYRYAFTYFKPENSMVVGVITFVILIGLTIVYFKLQKKLEQ